jgi:hypothetical protein
MTPAESNKAQATEAICAVCGKAVAAPDQEEHLRTNHFGPHYFWLDGMRYRSTEPSMRMAEIKALTKCAAIYQVYQKDKHGGDNIARDDGDSIDLTQEPHFFAVPPATMLHS